MEQPTAVIHQRANIYNENNHSSTYEAVVFECHLHQRKQMCTCEISLKAAILLSVGNH